MLFGKFPFNPREMSHSEAIQLMTQGTCLRLHIPEEQIRKSGEGVGVSDDVRDLLSRLLHGNPDARMSVREALNHR